MTAKGTSLRQSVGPNSATAAPTNAGHFSSPSQVAPDCALATTRTDPRKDDTSLERLDAHWFLQADVLSFYMHRRLPQTIRGEFTLSYAHRFSTLSGSSWSIIYWWSLTPIINRKWQEDRGVEDWSKRVDLEVRVMIPLSAEWMKSFPFVLYANMLCKYSVFSISNRDDTSVSLRTPMFYVYLPVCIVFFV